MIVYRPDGPRKLIKVIILVSNTHWIAEKCQTDLKTEPLATNQGREIDEHDVDLLLAVLSDHQIAKTVRWSEEEAALLRRSRWERPLHPKPD